ncbi:response regulator transcription factor [Saccharophagus degradans]|uniref:Response regulator transcription factor n=1 Tax=Saccharophagus degradans TaxID=86304 RepID=A0AAW7X6R7_9GAMM|nr:response regulator transcription factor [Saccharophagus degradans]MDO6423363.1 response regulator transcription factor [Saccharophagus degradans]MDO6606768.1 response regulator transcription factor [Saccharophagus degradans]
METNHGRTTILLVEDDASLAQWIADYLTNNNYHVTTVMRGDEAVNVILTTKPDLVLLDIMLPGKDGFEVCKEVRASYPNPILMMTARDDEIDEVLGLEIGANDYITKPVRPRALVARIKSLLKNTAAADKPDVASTINIGGLSIDNTARSVHINGVPLSLSSSEYNVFWVLANNAGEPISRENLIKAIRKIQYNGYDRSIDIVVSRLRKKIGDDSSAPTRIVTVWGKGYMLATSVW